MEAVSKLAVAMGDMLHQKTVLYCKQLVGSVLKMGVNKIDSSEPLGSLGIDSIIVGQINARLQEHFDDINNSLLFEFQTIDALAEHLVKTQKTNLLNLFELEPGTDQEALIPVKSFDQTPVKLNPRVTGRRSRRSRVINNSLRGEKVATFDRRIAIIGISGMYPQAANLEEYWENLKSGKNCTTEIPAIRWPQDDFYDPDVQRASELGKSYCKWGGFVDQFSEFDASFFGISPLEALSIDPQERLFLQSSWLALENAGYTRSTLKSKYKQKVGVFAGITKLGYNLYGSSRTIRENKFFPRTSFSSVANRLSYFLDINGPSMPIDTMCSSSLTAIHEACEHIYRGECQIAFAGGVNLYLHPSSYIDLSMQGMLSKDGLCKSFGEGADGFVPGEGVGVVLLKPLAKAVQDKDTIHGVILATHINHGGRSNGYTVPNPKAQTDVIRQAIDKAGINAREISYIEAHGTGTELGDSIEISVLQQAFTKDSQDPGYCRIGSVKSNIGHSESAAGMSGLTKVLLQMRHRQIAPSLHSERLNPHINLEKSPFVLNRDLTAWEPPVIDGQKKSRIAGISSFGAGGTNAHVIVQEYPPPAEIKQPGVAPSGNVIVAVPLSARTEEQLRQKALDLLNFIHTSRGAAETPETPDLAAVAYTLQVGREAMDERLGFMASSLDQLSERLQAYLDGGEDMEDTYRGYAKQDKDTLLLFSSDSDLKETLGKWIGQRKLSNLLKLWVKGLDVDWEKLYGEDRPHRICVPTYPFAKQRYWIDSLGIAQPGSFNVPGTGASSAVNSAEHVSAEPIASGKWRFSIESTSGEESADAVQNRISMSALDKIELFLKQKISFQLQVPIQDIARNKNLIEMGIDSMGITKLIRDTNQLLQENILPSVLFEHSDIQKFAEHLLTTYPEKINALVVEKSKRQANTDTQQNTKKRELTPLPRKKLFGKGFTESLAEQGNGAGLGDPPFKTEESNNSLSQLPNNEKTTSFDILVPMQPKGNKLPIFGMPGGSGNALALLPLSRALGNKQPFYGLQAVGLDGKTPPLDSMEKAAKTNIEALQAIQSTGPYTLIGYSNGGVVAYEMTRILLEQGEDIGSLILLDSLCPLQRVNNVIEEAVEISNYFMSTLDLDLDLDVKQLQKIPEEKRCEYLYEIMTAHGLQMTREQFTSGYNVAKASDHCCRTYRPLNLSRNIDVSLFRATESYADMPDDYGWNEFLLSPVLAFDIEADHFTIVNEGPINKVAKKILHLIKKKYEEKS